VKDYEARSVQFFKDVIDKMDNDVINAGCFVDVGAHVGLYSAQIASYLLNAGLRSQIYALEPMEISYRRLTKTAEQGATGIVPLHMGAWNMTGSVYISPGGIPARAYLTDAKLTGKNARVVQVVALDDVARQPNNKCWGMKIDVEGAEWLVLNGARNLLTTNEVMAVCLEYSTDHFTRYGYKANTLNAFMMNHGFRYHTKKDEYNATHPIQVGSIVNVHWVKGL
jgi:FkbM family methyltransferase